MTVSDVVRGAQAYCPVIVVDDGSTDNPPAFDGIHLIRFEQNRGKGAALQAGFAKAAELGFTHVVTMDADGQHFSDGIPNFLEEAARQPGALLVGVRDFSAAKTPKRQWGGNLLSNFWFRVGTGVQLGDTQCGFRCYPLASTMKIRTRAQRYAFELESLVRAAWLGIPIVAVPVRSCYSAAIVRQSHYRPIVDFVRITKMQFGLVAQSLFVPLELRRAWSEGEARGFRKSVAAFFTEHAHEPWRLSCAVGLGLFFGIAPIWGFQMLATVTLAHWLRLNKAIALLASNISIPPIAPFILYAALVLGHWLFTKQGLEFSPDDMTMARVWRYFGEWFVGSLVLGGAVAMLGMAVAYGVTRLVRRR